MGNAVLSKILKKLIREPRPAGSPKKDHGMPSSHAQSIYYFATVLISKIVVSMGSETAGSITSFIAGCGGIGSIVMYSYYAW
jgi:membrane-associated phospholipid phosphatase